MVKTFNDASTPRPWRVLGDSTRIVADLPTGETLVICDGIDAGNSLFSGPSIERSKSDMRTIVSAVNSHEALINVAKEFLSLMNKLSDESVRLYGDDRKAIRMARAAIVIAEKGQATA